VTVCPHRRRCPRPGDGLPLGIPLSSRYDTHAPQPAGRCDSGLLGTVAARAEVRLPALLSENVVLQRERPIRIWGWAEPGERVSVRLGEQEAVATTDTDGNGGPMSMTVEGRNRLTIENVLIGDVWICSGQSNMKFTLRRCDGGGREAASADFPLMRLFTVKRTAAPQPQPDCPGRWAVCSEDCCTATIQSFMSRSALQADPAFAEVLKSTEELAEAHRRGGLESPEARYAGKSPPTWLFNGMIAPLRRFTIRGVIWYQGESNVREPVLYRKLFPAMIRDWRSQWGQGNFPFLFAQMANFQRRPHPGLSAQQAGRRAATGLGGYGDRLRAGRLLLRTDLPVNEHRGRGGSHPVRPRRRWPGHLRRPCPRQLCHRRAGQTIRPGRSEDRRADGRGP